MKYTYIGAGYRLPNYCSFDPMDAYHSAGLSRGEEELLTFSFPRVLLASARVVCPFALLVTMSVIDGVSVDLLTPHSMSRLCHH